MEIGHPTDVKHVAHIGVDYSSSIAPSWMNEFKIGSDKTSKPTGKSEVSTRSSQDTMSQNLPFYMHVRIITKSTSHYYFVTDIDQSMESQPATDITRNQSCTDIPNVTKKRRRRKRSASVSESSSTKSSRLSKTKAKNPNRVHH
ncbi:hypothetical protein HRI_005129100 [Hibiscus trionum]|uniref:CRIB domain-containing protein n=1 Tax=Hibiscus trionum TaxID=183268 RepID=A0A9W7JJJ2_HIBTR|nr:hypothetical protein HRI_005129100 [Hibiscus trionum]